MSILACLAILFTFVSLLLLLCGLFGYKGGYWGLGFSLLSLNKWAVYFSIFTVCFSLISVGYLSGRKRGPLNFLLMLSSGALSTFIVIVFYNYNLELKSNPFINDVSTDYVNYLKFHEYSKHDEKNLSDNNLYLQKFGGFKQPYNTLKPLLISQEQIVVFNKTLEVFDLMGLEIVYSNQQEGIIEAVDTSFWYDFKDDIIVRIETLVSGDVKVDARSASRIGKSDFGVNAKRINTLMELLQESLI